MWNAMRNAIRRWGRRGDDRGATATEYIIILVLVAVAAVGVWNSFGQGIRDRLMEARDNVMTESGTSLETSTAE